jgi:P4 family phage/plasmid primase-like protien
MALRTFLQSRRTTDSEEWNLTGMGTDAGKYFVAEADYDTFLDLVHQHIFGPRPAASSLLERHRDVGPLLVDLDFRYQAGGPLVRRFTDAMVRRFVAEYISAYIYFAEIEKCEGPLRFYMMVKPQPESDKGQHKDGIHIQCPDLVSNPKIQYAIRGFLLNHGSISSIFGSTNMNNMPDNAYDVSVIHKNNWFLYGACKPNKAQYTVRHVWRVDPALIAEALDGGTPSDFQELVEVVEDLMEDNNAEDTLADADEFTKRGTFLKRLSIRKDIEASNIPPIRPLRKTEWDGLVGMWGSGKAKPDGRQGTLQQFLPQSDVEREGREEDSDGELVVANQEDARRISSTYSTEDIAFAYRIARQCLNPERRASAYDDWVRLAICLRNIAATDESFRVWMEISRRVPGYESRMSDNDYKIKWSQLRDDATRRLGMGSLIRWAEEDAPETMRAIKSETNRDWIMNYAKDTHVNVASFVCRLYQHEFRCSYGAKRAAEWFQYVDEHHAWKHLRTPTELRSRLSGDVRNHYIDADREYGRRITIAAEAEKAVLEEKRKKIFTIERQLEMASFKDNVLKECAEKFYDDEFISHLDCNPYLLGVANGVLELNWQDPVDGKYKVRFRKGEPDDYVSFQMGRCEPDLPAIPYIPWSAVDPVDKRGIEGFFELIYPDPVLRNYVLTLLSSCLEGQNKEQRFYIMQGRGSNGKSKIQELMSYTFGEYQTSLQTTTLTRKRPDAGNANPELIVVKGKRFVHMGEPDQGEKINTARMKQWSGGDFVEARGMYADQEKFKMMCKFFLSCNDLPPVSSMDDGTWRRIRTIPHEATFVDPGKPTNPEAHIHTKDLDMDHKLRKWRVAFLSMLVHYYDTSYRIHGLQEPDSVTAASRKYKEENDTFHAFLSENFVLEAGAGPLTIGVVKDVYKDWKRTQISRSEIKPRELVDRLRAICDKKSTEKEFWGIRVLATDEETDADSVEAMRASAL